MVAPAPGSEGSQALGPTSSPVHHSETPTPPILPLLDVPYIGTPPVGCIPVRFLEDSNTQSRSAPPNGAPAFDLGRGPIPKPPKPKPAVGAAHHRMVRNHTKCHQKCTTMVWVPATALKSTTAGTALIMVVTSQPRTSRGRIQLTLIWNQPQGIVLHVQIWSWPSEQHERDSGRGCRPPIALQGAAFDWSPK